MKFIHEDKKVSIYIYVENLKKQEMGKKYSRTDRIKVKRPSKWQRLHKYQWSSGCEESAAQKSEKKKITSNDKRVGIIFYENIYLKNEKKYWIAPAEIN